MITYNPEHHRYEVDGRVIDFSVTGVLPKVDFHCTQEQLEMARLEGNDLHSLVKMYHDNLCTFEVPFLNEYQDFILANCGLLGDFIECETPRYSARLDFIGTPDLIFSKAIVDLKRTMGEKRYHALQLAGYSILARENKIVKTDKHFVLTYGDKGFKLVNVFNPQAEDVFRMLLQNAHNEKRIQNYFKTI